MSDPVDLDELLVACLSRLEHEGDAGLEAVCAEHPAAAQVLRERVRLLRAAGLVAPSPGERDDPHYAPPDFPDRLGDFRLLERLGQGGMGVVYLARQDSLERLVALKLIRPEQLYFPGARKRFAREVEAVSRLAHPGIVPVHVVGEEGGIPFFAMEYVRGASLEDVFEVMRGRNPAVLTGHDLYRATAEHLAAAEGLQPDAEVTAHPPFDDSWTAACLWIAREVAQSLEHAHQRGVLHRDVKPSNVMLTPEGRVLLVDFGLASAEGSSVLTGSGARVGSLAYMAPEQVEGRLDLIGRATDVYGLGVTLYQLLALRRPFAGNSLSTIQRAILDGSTPRLRAVAPTTSRDLDAVVAKAMDRDLTRRYASAADLARDLTRVIEQHPVEARAPGPWMQLVRWTQRNRAAAVALGLGLIIAVGGPLLFGFQQRLLTSRITSEKERADHERDQAEAQRAVADEQRALAQRERAEADLQKGRAEEREREAETQRARAEGSLERALEAIELMLTRVAERQLVDVPQMERVRQALMVDALRLFDELVRAAATDAPGQSRVGAELRWRSTAVGVALADLEQQLGDRDAARRLLEDQLVALRDLTEETGEGRYRAGLALAIGRLAWLELDRAGPERALELADEGLALLEAGLVLGPEGDKAWAQVLHARMTALERLGRGPDALRTAERLVEVQRRELDRAPDDPERIRRLAAVLGERGRIVLGHRNQETIDYVGRGLALLRELIDADPHDGFARLNFCELVVTQSAALGFEDRHAEAHAVVVEAVAMAESLARDHPTADQFRERLAKLRVNQGVEASSIGRIDEALEALSQAADELGLLVEVDPGSAERQHALGGALSNLSSVFLENGRAAEADEPLRRAIEAHRMAVARQPQNGFFRFHLGLALLNRGLFSIEEGRFAAAPRFLDEALPMIGLDPSLPRQIALQWLRGARLVDGAPELEAPERNALATEYLEGALRALAAAVEAGSLGPDELADEVWDPLRELEGFGALGG